MKAKKTIRKMAHRPVARALAHFQRDLGNMNRRLTRLVELAEALETKNRVALRTETELRERLARAEAGAGASGQPGRAIGLECEHQAECRTAIMASAEPGEALFEYKPVDTVRHESGPQPIPLTFVDGMAKHKALAPDFNSPSRPPEAQAEIDNFNGGRCVCGHSGAEHGTRGQYCCRINCLCHGFKAAGEAFHA